MNIDLQIMANISKLSVTAKQKDDVVRRICRLTLGREFDSTIAAALGEDAKQAREALIHHGIEEVTIPLDGIVASAKLIHGTVEVTIPVMRGVKAKAKAGNIDDENPPSVRLEFDFDFYEPAWVFCGRYCNAYVEATLTEVQPTLPGVNTDKSKKTKAPEDEDLAF
jgi:hypothetical protein